MTLEKAAQLCWGYKDMRQLYSVSGLLGKQRGMGKLVGMHN